MIVWSSGFMIASSLGEMILSARDCKMITNECSLL